MIFGESEGHVHRLVRHQWNDKLVVLNPDSASESTIFGVYTKSWVPVADRFPSARLVEEFIIRIVGNSRKENSSLGWNAVSIVVMKSRFLICTETIEDMHFTWPSSNYCMVGLTSKISQVFARSQCHVVPIFTQIEIVRVNLEYRLHVYFAVEQFIFVDTAYEFDSVTILLHK